MREPTTRSFYDELAADYHLIYEDWGRSATRQGAALDAVAKAEFGAAVGRTGRAA
ncbi:hypothetical protein ACFQVC_20330 [Streptomyces monticola]|uniref:SAM-dependent methyltransferase n=1 Tax=Streptomyces monticola TaxID=2666263 RepID=A0ABW2JMM4_9ACTN